MSYARFGADGSDVYVFVSTAALECCMCSLQPREWVDEPGRGIAQGYFREVAPHIEQDFTSNAGMIAHLELHRMAGHTVPEYVFDRLRDPADAAENEAIWAKHRTAPR